MLEPSILEFLQKTPHCPDGKDAALEYDTLRNFWDDCKNPDWIAFLWSHAFNQKFVDVGTFPLAKKQLYLRNFRTLVEANNIMRTYLPDQYWNGKKCGHYALYADIAFRLRQNIVYPWDY